MCEENRVKSTVVVHGATFSENFGDTLLVSMMCKYIANIVGKDNVYISSVGVEQECIDIGFPKIPKSLESHVTHLIYAGGGYFGEPKLGFVRLLAWSIRNYYRHCFRNKRFSNASIGIFSVGFGPVSNWLYRNAILSLIKRARIVTFRDAESIDIASSYGVDTSKLFRTTDMALDLYNCHVSEAVGVRRILGLHVHGLALENFELVLKEVVKFSQEKGLSIRILFDNKTKDIAKIKKSYLEAGCDISNCQLCEFVPYKDYSALVAEISQCHVIVTRKLHVGIVGAALGCKVLSIPSHQKTVRFYNQIGMQSYCIPESLLQEVSLRETLLSVEKFSFDYNCVGEELALNKRLISDFLTGSFSEVQS